MEFSCLYTKPQPLRSISVLNGQNVSPNVSQKYALKKHNDFEDAHNKSVASIVTRLRQFIRLKSGQISW